ncbi:hypothetical protein [Streptomyces sp. NPDC017524]|uniref:hypothetical protein n=1 Tax=unclassified Streptomyces TaxID=2593676 RepID=UPI0037BBA4E1
MTQQTTDERPGHRRRHRRSPPSTRSGSPTPVERAVTRRLPYDPPRRERQNLVR